MRLPGRARHGEDDEIAWVFPVYVVSHLTGFDRSDVRGGGLSRAVAGVVDDLIARPDVGEQIEISLLLQARAVWMRRPLRPVVGPPPAPGPIRFAHVYRDTFVDVAEVVRQDARQPRGSDERVYRPVIVLVAGIAPDEGDGWRSALRTLAHAAGRDAGSAVDADTDDARDGFSERDGIDGRHDPDLVTAAVVVVITSRADVAQAFATAPDVSAVYLVEDPERVAAATRAITLDLAVQLPTVVEGGVVTMPSGVPGDPGVRRIGTPLAVTSATRATSPEHAQVAP